ncbi:MAG: hypothetical protein KKD63_04485 [Proteobacteria bacterium]|nr:hypothetical protein [Desulfobulbaceae bacterium]MBU4152119.1 hypothetical protein [Pseudomonadota bacterium]
MNTSTVENIDPYRKPLTDMVMALPPKKSNSPLLSTLAFCCLTLSPYNFTYSIPTCPSDLKSSIGYDHFFSKGQTAESLLLRGYHFESVQQSSIELYLDSMPLAKSFVAQLGPIIERVYSGLAVEKKINLLADPDTGESIMEIVLSTNLPIDELFVAKDRQLFDEIEKEGLTDGLRHVVLTQA